MKIVLYITFLFLTSCVVSSQKYSEIATKSAAYSVVIENQNKELEQLKTHNNELINKNLLLLQDTIRLENYIRTLKQNYNNIIDQGASTTIASQRKASEYQAAISRNNNQLSELREAILDRESKMNLIELTISREFQKRISSENAILYQTKAGFNLELDDCAVLNDSTIQDSVRLFIGEITPFLVSEEDISLSIESYSAQNDTLSSPIEIWETNLRKGAVYADMFIEKGLDVKRVKVISPGTAYLEKSPFASGCELVTIIKFNLDASYIIDKFDKLIINRNNISILN